jgi:Glycosyl hydrolase 36 superfamily, catalytic domain
MTTQPTRQPAMYDHVWSMIDGLPVCRISQPAGSAGHPHAHHPLAGWRMKANVYFDGTVRCFSGEFGSRFFAPAPFHATARRAQVVIDGVSRDLDLNREPAAERALHCGRWASLVPVAGGSLRMEAVNPQIDGRSIFVRWRWSGSSSIPQLRIPVDLPGATVSGSTATVEVPHYGRVTVQVGGSFRWEGTWIVADLSHELCLRISTHTTDEQILGVPTTTEVDHAIAANDAWWRQRLGQLPGISAGIPAHDLAWSVMLAVGTAVFDGHRQRLCCTNGALYAFDHLHEQLDQPWGMYSFRDGNQVAFGVARLFPELARDQILRTIEAFEPERGIPQMSSALPGSDYSRKAPGGEHGDAADMDPTASFSSEQAWWWAITLSEYVQVTGDVAVLSHHVNDGIGRRDTVLGHLERLMNFGIDIVGVGSHGICRFLSGDWNDFLGRLGSRGRGESFMNAGLAVIACERAALLPGVAAAVAQRLRDFADGQRRACAPALNGGWYPRAFDDHGTLIGGADDRLYLDSQPWLALARIGTAAQRRQALSLSAERTLTPIGTILIDRPLVTREEIAAKSHVLYPAGTGENGCVWWLCGWWLAMALAAEGLREVADQVAAACTRTRHRERYPDQWWSGLMAPDGIDGPASPHYGKAQQPGAAYPEPWAQGFPREINPNEVAKYPFQLWYAINAGRGMLPG